MANTNPETKAMAKEITSEVVNGQTWQTYLLPSGRKLKMLVPTLLHLDEFENIQLDCGGRPMRQMLRVLEMLGVDNLGEFRPEDLESISYIVRDFFDTSATVQADN